MFVLSAFVGISDTTSRNLMNSHTKITALSIDTHSTPKNGKGQ